MKTIFYTLIIIIIPFCGQAQFYEFVSFNRIYFESDNWTSLTNGEVWDDPDLQVDLPFDFEFYGETINTLYVYGSFIATDESYMSPFDLDIIDRGYNDNQSLSEIRYTTEVTDDNELFIIEWHNVGFYAEIYDGSESVSYISFQVIFNKKFNAIEFSYGESNIINPSYLYNDESGASVYLAYDYDDISTAITQSICLIDDANTPTALDFDFVEGDAGYLTGDIPANKSYLFSIGETVSTANYIDFDEVNIFPSPAVDRVNIESDLKISKYRLMSSMGQNVRFDNLNENYIDLSTLQSGMYFLELTDVIGNTVTRPIIKR